MGVAFDQHHHAGRLNPNHFPLFNSIVLTHHPAVDHRVRNAVGIKHNPLKSQAAGAGQNLFIRSDRIDPLSLGRQQRHKRIPFSLGLVLPPRRREGQRQGQTHQQPGCQKRGSIVHGDALPAEGIPGRR